MKRVSTKTFLSLLDLFRSNDEAVKGKSLFIKNNLKGHPANYFISSEIKPSRFQTEDRIMKKSSENLGISPKVLTKMLEVTCNTYLISASPITIDTEHELVKEIPQIDFIPIRDVNLTNDVITRSETGIVNKKGNVYIETIDTSELISRLEELSCNQILD